MAMIDRVNAAILDVDSQIAHLEQEKAAKIAALQKKKTVLQAAAGLLTPELENAIVTLQQIGVLDI